MADRLLIIGGVAAGTKAAATARRSDPSARITLLQNEADVSYSACGLPYWLEPGRGISREKLVARTPDAFRSDGIEVRTRHQVEEIDTQRAIVKVLDRDAGRNYSEQYDKLLIATGAYALPFKARVSESAPAVAYLRSIADADHLSGLLPGVSTVVIIGGGYIGLEMAETFTKRGLRVVIVEMMPRILLNFDETIATVVQTTLQKHGVEVFTGIPVVELDQGHVVLADGTRIRAGLVLVAMGVRPATVLAASAGIKLGKTGAIAVTAGMRTNVPNIFAAGDCVESRHVLSKQSLWMPLGDVANRQGRVAGINMAGGNAKFPGVLGTAIFQVFDLAVARTGLGPAAALTAGFDPVTEVVVVPSRARYMSKSRPLHVRLTADRITGLLLGCEVVGEDAVDKTIDIMATALWGKLRTNDLAELDFAYAPPFSPVLAPSQVAGEVLNKVVTEARATLELSMFCWVM